MSKPKAADKKSFEKALVRRGSKKIGADSFETKFGRIYHLGDDHAVLVNRGHHFIMKYSEYTINSAGLIAVLNG